MSARIAADRVFARERAQPRRAVREHARAIGQAHARNRARCERFDLAGFEDALGHCDRMSPQSSSA